MKPKTALRKSIKEKWEPGLMGRIGYLCSPLNCECCKQFHYNLEGCNCRGCPIREDGHQFCEGTPYAEFEPLWEVYYGDDIYELHAEVNAAAQWELDYLKDLYKRLEDRE